VKDESDCGYALQGVGVLDLAGGQGSFSSRLLADLGARVIKVEKPGGDPSREIGPYLGSSPDPEKSLFFFFNNANKLGITLDLQTREGMRIFLQLVRRNDIIIESYQPGHMETLGLGLEALREANPSIVVVSVTGFGQDGARRDYLACDLVASAFGGQMFICGEPEKPPIKPYGHQSYYSASLFAAIAALIGLREKRKGQRNLFFDISLQEAVTATLEHVLIRYFNDKRVAQREGGLHWDRGFCIFPCREAFILLTLFQQWPTLVEWMASENMAEDLVDKKWEEEPYRREHIDHVIEVIDRWTRTHTAQELCEMGQSLRFPWAPVRSLRDVLCCPQLMARGFFVEVEVAGSAQILKLPGMPCRYGMPVLEKWTAPPRIGEHNHQIYHGELGIPYEEIERLVFLGVI
jgi:crotonobetainyl-CoA:carnitine CoA-transferase CaiB-like acyl-CoA transferase